MVGRMAMLSLYLFGPILGICSYVSSRGPDGDVRIAVVLFVAVGVAYTVLMPICCRRRATVHSIGHLVAFAASSIMGCAIDSQLEEMGGVLLGAMPLSAMAIAVSGAFALLIVRSPAMKS